MSAPARRSGATDGASDAAADTAGVATDTPRAPTPSAEDGVAELLQLQRAVAQAAASARGRLEVAEAHERLLAAAVRTQPEDSFVTASVLRACVAARLAAAAPVRATLRPSTLQARAGAIAALWRDDTALLCASRRCLALLTARCAAGTLWTPTPTERAFLAHEAAAAAAPLELLGAELLVSCAQDALRWWPGAEERHASGAARGDAEEMQPEDAVRLRGVHAALRALLERDASSDGGLDRCARTGRPLAAVAPGFVLAVRSLLSALGLTAAGDAASTAGCASPLLQQLRAACGLTRADEAALRRLEHRLSGAVQKEQLRAAVTRAAAPIPTAFGGTVFADLRTLSRERAARGAAADNAARTALWRCALPACDAREARPRAFMLCTRCRGAAYCCALHQTQDCRRHKVTDGCSPSHLI